MVPPALCASLPCLNTPRRRYCAYRLLSKSRTTGTKAMAFARFLTERGYREGTFSGGTEWPPSAARWATLFAASSELDRPRAFTGHSWLRLPFALTATTPTPRFAAPNWGYACFARNRASFRLPAGVPAAAMSESMFAARPSVLILATVGSPITDSTAAPSAAQCSSCSVPERWNRAADDSASASRRALMRRGR
jgi:hypothetical protein